MSLPRFPSAKDSNGFAHFNHEVYKSMFREVTVYPFQTQVKTIEDNIYGEDMKQVWPEELAYVCPVYVAVLPGWKTKITAEGVDEDRPLTLYFDKEGLVQDNHPLPATGFLIFLQGEYYRVFQDNPTDYFANLDRAYTHVVLVQRYRTESVSRGEVTGDEPAVLRSDYPHE